MELSAEVRSALEFFATAQSFREGCQAYKNEVYLLPTELDEVSQRTHREHSPNGVVGKVLVQSLRVSSEDRRTAARGQTVKQCTELQSALDFFSTRQLKWLTLPILPHVQRPMGCSPSSHHAGMSAPVHLAQLSMSTHHSCMTAPEPTQRTCMPG